VLAGGSSSTKIPSGVPGICPSGWHVPSDSEWTTLVSAVEANPLVGTGQAGTSLKSRTGWNGNDLFGFTVLPGGGVAFLTSSTVFKNAGVYAFFWLATEKDVSDALHGSFAVNHADVAVDYDTKTDGFSLRCAEN